MEGRITGIAWRQLLSNEASNSGERYGPAIPIESTDDLPEDVDWILEFTVETSDPIPEPRTDFL